MSRNFYSSELAGSPRKNAQSRTDRAWALSAASIQKAMSAAWTNTLKNRRNALPAANAHRHQRIAALDALQFMQGFDGNQGTSRANRMAQRNTRAVGVDLDRTKNGFCTYL